MPIETTRGTFYHYPKAGGTWVTQVLLEQFNGKRFGRGGHLPVWAYPPPTAPAFGVVRDPFTLYKSYYKHAIRGKREGGIAYWGRALNQDWLDSITFESFLYGMTHPWEVPEFEPGSLGIIYQPLEPDRAIEELRADDVGFASWMLFDMFGRAFEQGIEVTLLPLHNLEKALGEMMGEEIRPTRKQATNSSSHITVNTDYTDEMRKWVEEADAEMLMLYRTLASVG